MSRGDTWGIRALSSDDDTVVDVGHQMRWLPCAIGQTGGECTGVPTSLDWAEAIDACETLVQGPDDFVNRDEWRLPSRGEVETILYEWRYSEDGSSEVFPNAWEGTRPYATSTPLFNDEPVAAPIQALAVTPLTGEVRTKVDLGLEGLAVRCVADEYACDGEDPDVDYYGQTAPALACAAVTFYEYPSMTSFYTTTTTSSASGSAGYFTLPANMSDSSIYIVKVTGGTVAEATVGALDLPVNIPNEGSLGAVVLGQWLKQPGSQELTVSVVSDLAYQRLWYLLSSGASNGVILTDLERLAQLLIRPGFDPHVDGGRSGRDLIVAPELDVGSEWDAYYPTGQELSDALGGALAGEWTRPLALELTDPIVATAFTQTGHPRIAGGGDDLYVVGTNRIDQFDISDAGSPIPEDTHWFLPNLSWVEDVLLHDGWLYIAARDDGVVVVDVRGEEMEVGPTVDTPGSATQLALDGTRLFVADGLGGLRVINVSTPSAAAEIDDAAFGTNVTAVHARSGEVYVGYIGDDPSAFNAVAVVNPATLATIGVATGALGNNDTVPKDIVDDGGDILFVGDFYSRLGFVDISDPEHPDATLDPVHLGAGPSEMLRDGDRLYFNSTRTDHGGVWVLGISTPTDPELYGRLPAGASPSGLYIKDGLLYTEERELLVIDPSVVDPGFVIGEYPVTEYDRSAPQVAVEGDTAYLLREVYGVYTLDVTDPLDPNLQNAYSAGWGYDMDLSDGRLTVTGGNGTLRVWELLADGVLSEVYADDRSGMNERWIARHGETVWAAESGDIQTPGESDSIWVIGRDRTAAMTVHDDRYLLVSGEGLDAYDLGATTDDISFEHLLTSPDVPYGSAHELVVDGGSVFAAADFEIYAADVSGLPATLSLQGRLSGFTDAYGIDVYDGARRWIYVADGAYGVVVVDANELDDMRIMARIPTPGVAKDVAVGEFGGYVYVADGLTGMQVLGGIISPAP